MRRYTKPLIIAVVAVLALTIGITSVALVSGASDSEGATAIQSIALASDTSGNGTNGSTDNQTEECICPREIFINKTADILGVDAENLTAAMQQARQEMRYEAMVQRLEQAVEDGLITEEEAAEILEWYESRPEALDKLEPQRHQCRGMNFRNSGHWGRLAWNM